jgi:RHH-type proline utilization regulon transcriptional repressor/proline dehydrogenase/delta 1-pyrroline-5-carboxylate dehydrogenase
VGHGAAQHQVERVLRLAVRAGVPVSLSDARRESDARFARRIAAGQVRGRVRVVGESAGLHEAAAARAGDVTVLDRPVLADGRREALTVLREQAVSRTLHRFGHLPGSGLPGR